MEDGFPKSKMIGFLRLTNLDKDKVGTKISTYSKWYKCLRAPKEENEHGTMTH